jgi:hypothetical protein
MGKPKYPLFSQVDGRREKRDCRSGETCFETNCTFKHVNISEVKKKQNGYLQLKVINFSEVP